MLFLLLNLRPHLFPYDVQDSVCCLLINFGLVFQVSRPQILRNVYDHLFVCF